MGKNGIPDRWLPYSPMGSVVPGTCFFACKVPLKDSLLRKLPENERFGPKDLLNSFPKLGLLIDLTNTTRYYMKEDFTLKQVKYEKIFCPGRVIPHSSVVKQFFVVVDRFLDEFKEADLLIGVHCTHGVNRTGYFICRYMIEKLKIPPEDAVERFQQARGHNIERQMYVDDLKNGCKGGPQYDVSFRPLPVQQRKRGREISPFSRRLQQARAYNTDHDPYDGDLKNERKGRSESSFSLTPLCLQGEKHIQPKRERKRFHPRNNGSNIKEKSARRNDSNCNWRDKSKNCTDASIPSDHLEQDRYKVLHAEEDNNRCPSAYYRGHYRHHNNRNFQIKPSFNSQRPPQSAFQTSGPPNYQPPYKKQPSNQAPFKTQPFISNQPPFKTQPSISIQPSFITQPSISNQPPFKNQPSISNQPPFQHQPHRSYNRSWIRKTTT